MRLTQLHFSLSVLLLVFLSACGNHDDVVVSVYGHDLYKSELSKLISDEMTPEDSVVIVQNYISQWIAQRVVLNEAEEVIDDNFEEQVEAYRNSLLVSAYEKYYVEKNIDSNISNDEVTAYYHTHTSDFTLRSSIVKAAFVRVSRNSVSSGRLRAIFSMQSISDTILSEAQRIAATDAEDYFFGQNMWIPFSHVCSLMPLSISNESAFLQQNKFHEVSDDNSFYFVHFFEVKTIGQLSPLETEYDKVRSIILNRRRSELVSSMYQQLLKSGESSGKIVFDDDGED